MTFRRWWLPALLCLPLAGCGSQYSSADTSKRSCTATQRSLSGQPSWLPIGLECYQERDVDVAEQELLALRMQPRWFRGFGRAVTREEFEAFETRIRTQMNGAVSLSDHDGHYAIPDPPPYPQSFADLPLEDGGVSLTLSASVPADDIRGSRQELRLELALTSADAPLSREVEHRWTNTLPFLFAFYVDGDAVVVPWPGFGRWGGMRSMVPLVASGETRTWSVRVDPASLRAVLPDDQPHDVAIVAAFANQQHLAHQLDNPIGNELSAGTAHFERQLPPRPIVIRSEPTHLRWTGNAWRAAAANTQVRPAAPATASSAPE